MSQGRSKWNFLVENFVGAHDVTWWEFVQTPGIENLYFNNVGEE